jgi:hypothetical protein
MTIFTTKYSQLTPFYSSVSDSVKMSESAASNSSDNIQECQLRSLFTNLPSACLAIVIYVDVAKNFDYSNPSRSFSCTVCAHGYHLSNDGQCTQISNCDANFSNKDSFLNGCGSCESGYSLSFFDNNGNSSTLSFDINSNTNSDLDNNTTKENRYMNQWIYNHHDLSLNRDIYNNISYKNISEIDYTTCHDVSSETIDQTNCLVYNFIDKKCSICRKGFVHDNFGSCQLTLPVGCQAIGDHQLDINLTLDPTWSSIDLTSTASDNSRVLATDLQLLSYYSGMNRSCETCEFGWKQYHLFTEDVIYIFILKF